MPSSLRLRVAVTTCLRVDTVRASRVRMVTQLMSYVVPGRLAMPNRVGREPAAVGRAQGLEGARVVGQARAGFTLPSEAVPVPAECRR